jgi:hypothetical protein
MCLLKKVDMPSQTVNYVPEGERLTFSLLPGDNRTEANKSISRFVSLKKN